MSFVDTSWWEGSGRAFLLAVLGAALFTAFVIFVLILYESPRFIGAAALIGLYAFVIAAIVIGIAAAIIGLPLTWLAARAGLEGVWTYVLAGFASGGAVVTLVPSLTGDLRGDSVFEFLPYSGIGALPGAVCGALWWLLCRRHLKQSGDQSA